MGQLTPEFLFNLETNMKVISAQSYGALNRESHWSMFAKRMPSLKRKERLIWFLDTARIDFVNRLGSERLYEDIVSKTVEYESRAATGALTLRKPQLDDIDGDGVSLSAHWARGIGSYSAYWPEKNVFARVRQGSAATSIAYDGQLFFSTAHPVNPGESNGVTYPNDFTGAASGTYPGALPIHDAVTADVAAANIGKALAAIRRIKMPNGVDPRKLRAAFIAAPPAMANRVTQLTNARVIAQAAASGGGGADVEAVVRQWGIGQPIVVDELDASFTDGGSDTTWYMGVEEIGGDTELGALAYIDREAFNTTMYGPQNDAQLARMRTLEWNVDGRNEVVYGHPYKLFRFQAT